MVQCCVGDVKFVCFGLVHCYKQPRLILVVVVVDFVVGKRLFWFPLQ